MRAAKTVAALLVAAAAARCGGSADPPRPRDVLLITIDTARADRFSYAARGGPGTPRIDALAAEGAGFVNAISPVPLTLPAHASLMTGRLPPSHTVRDNGAYTLPAAERTLAQILADAGFSTGAFIGAQVLDSRYGLDRGFATYDDDIAESGDPRFRFYAERTGEQVVAATVRWLETQGDRPVFAWVHLFDPHTPYHPPEPERSRHASAYDGEIAYADRVVGLLLDRWATLRGLDRTAIVVTSDHGEALGEHDEATHGVLVHDATLRVPLVIRAPGRRVDRPIADPVSLVDVMPTILGLLGLPSPAGVQGRDLGPLLRQDPLAWSPSSGYAESLYAEIHHGCAPLFALREARWKLVRGVGSELYDLDADPAETRDLAGREPGHVAALGGALDRLMVETAGREPSRVPLDDDTRRALESLGYGWAPSAKAAPGTSPRDPREALATLRRMADADRLVRKGDLEGAVVTYRSVLDIEPQSVDARFRLAQILSASGRTESALPLMAEAVALAPQEPFLHQKLGNTIETLGRFADALRAYDAGLALHPGNRGLRDGRWRCLDRLRRHDVMLAEAERAIAADPKDGVARYARVIACCGRSPGPVYRAALERELRELPGDPTLAAALAAERRAAR